MCAVKSQLRFFKYVNVVCIIQVHTATSARGNIACVTRGRSGANPANLRCPKAVGPSRRESIDHGCTEISVCTPMDRPIRWRALNLIIKKFRYTQPLRLKRLNAGTCAGQGGRLPALHLQEEWGEQSHQSPPSQGLGSAFATRDCRLSTHAHRWWAGWAGGSCFIFRLYGKAGG